MILIGSAVAGNRGQLRNRHLEAAVAHDREHQLVGTRELRADGRGQAEAHGSQAAGVEPQPRLVEADQLRRPHLVLAHVGGDDGLAAARAGRSRAIRCCGLISVSEMTGSQRMLCLPLADLLPPGAPRRGDRASSAGAGLSAQQLVELAPARASRRPRWARPARGSCRSRPGRYPRGSPWRAARRPPGGR